MKIFLCSTFFDLEDLRALVVNRFGDEHEFIHFEDSAFPSRRGLHSHDQCIAAVKQADVVVCIVDRRYGGFYRGKNRANFPDQQVKFKGVIAGEKKTVVVTIPTKDLSISWCELLTAYREEKYVITFARKRTWDEKATRRENQGVADFRPAHVDDARVFDLLDWITKQPKDNWIIPFETAVDFLEKLGNWLDVAKSTFVPAAEEAPSDTKPITLIVEGQTDASIVKVVLAGMKLKHSVSIVVAQGKRALLGNLAVYATAFGGSAGLVVLADADTENPGDIELQRQQFRWLMEQAGLPNARLVLAVPEIEAWLGRTKFRRDEIRHFNRISEELYFLQEELEQREANIESLGEFMRVLREIDTRDEVIDVISRAE